MPNPARLLALAERIDAERAAAMRSRLPGADALLLATAYPAMTSWIERHPGELSATLVQKDALALEAKALNQLESADFKQQLRRMSNKHRARIALRELLPASLGGTDIDQSAAELSDLADVTIDAALDEAKRAVFARLGTPRDSAGREGKLTVLGMGKLGGRELNCGSDVDLVCVYDSDEHVASDGGNHSAHEIWSKVVQRMTANLADVTEHGFVWRVDLRLRPEGAAGPLVNSLAAAERYYEVFGRLWERAALLRARPVAGHKTFGKRVLRALDPFVWTKRVDPSIARQMFELVRRARAELSPNPERDLKLGPGGIREAEFFVQALQLIWGGREPRLRIRPTTAAVWRLRAAGLVTEREAQDLANAYAALRRAEHAVQWASGVQTHSLPRRRDALDRMGRTLGFDDGSAFVSDIEAHTSRVSALLTSLLPSGEARISRWAEVLLALDKDNFEELCQALRVAGMPDAEEHDQLPRDLFEMARLHPDAPLGSRSRERWRHLGEALLDAVADAADPRQAARYLRGLLARLRPPGVYTKMLADDPAAVCRLVTVLGGSSFVGDAVSARPELLDLVLFEHTVPTEETAMHEMLRVIDAPLSDADDAIEQQVGRIRRAQRRVTTQVALADLAAELDTPGATLVLAALADGALEAATRFALDTPSGQDVKGLAVIAMGKLGGRAVGYGSDLDVIFLYDPGQSEDPVDHFTRRARDIIRIIEMPHFEGPGYELDTRLRPSGNQGLLVVSLDAFARYHGVGDSAPGARRAATWERLALLRARFAAGDRELGTRAIAIATAAAYDSTTPVADLATDIHQLRMRMEQELAQERPGRYDLKLGRGGLVDVEFAVQLLQLRHGHDPSVRTTDTTQAIDALAAIGALDDERAASLREGYRFLRRLEQRVRVLHGDASHLLEERAAGLGPLARRMGFRDHEPSAAATRLLDRYRAVTDRVRRAYDDIVVRQIVQSEDRGRG